MAVYLVLAAITIALGFFVDSKVEKYDKSFFEDPNRSRGRAFNKLIYVMIFHQNCGRRRLLELHFDL